MLKPHKVDCPDCGTPMVLRPSKFGNGHFYGCPKFPACEGTHSAHPDGSPMGKPADQPTKDARHQLHAVFDTLWLGAWTLPCYNIDAEDENAINTIERAARKRAYAWLGEQMKMNKDECHIANFDIARCTQAAEICTRINMAGIREWFKGRAK